MLAFDMGLGKTFTALGIAREMIQTQSNIKVSICAPASLLPNWRESARLFDIPIYTSSYDARIPPIITKDTLVILDECHYLKNRDSNRWKRLYPALLKTNMRVLLTGTPMPNKPAELFTQLILLGMKQTWMSFTTQFCAGRYRHIRIGKHKKRIWDVSGSTQQNKLTSLINIHGVQFVHKRDVLPNLPTLTRTVVWFEMTQTHHAPELPTLVAYATTMLQLRIQHKPIWAHLLRLCQNEHRTLIFAKHTKLLQHTSQFLTLRGIPNYVIDGSSSVHMRQDMIQNAAIQKNILICSIGAMGTGFNATQYKQMIFLECSWSAGDQAQCEARIHRIGQSHHCLIYYFLIKNTVDEQLWHTIRRKKKWITQLCRQTDDSIL